jgi:hypothetical protein
MTAPPASAARSAPPAAAAPVADAGPLIDAGGGTPPGDAGSDAQAAAAAAGGEEAQPYAADNKVKPPEGRTEELQARAKGLFEAIVKKEPALGDPFWFPKEPFIPLKDVKGPEKYWKNLHQAYAEDIRKAHRKRKSWEGATFIGFDVGSTPKWVKPGDEVNKIGYYRSFHGKLRYEMDGEKYSIDVHTVISWQGRWYVTHLGKFK